jgi:hypothetical protein
MPNQRFTVRRVLGAGDLCVSELVMKVRWSANRNISPSRLSRDRRAHNGLSPLTEQAH